MRKLTTHCNRGHEFTEENTYVAKTGQRHCKSCLSVSNRRFRSTPGYKENYKIWMKKNRDKQGRNVRTLELRNFYGLTLEKHKLLYEAQKGVCAICKRPEAARDFRTNKIRSLSIDHNHKTKENRGLLCHFCNNALGLFRDDPEICRVAADYLENPPARKVLNG